MEENEMEKRILSSAKELFLKHGFDAVSTTQIAKKAGCNQALVHYYTIIVQSKGFWKEYYRKKPKRYSDSLPPYRMTTLLSRKRLPR